MKKFFEWFKSNTKMKRWLFLIILGIVAVCFGIAEIITKKELGFSELSIIITSFVVGFVFVVIGLIHIQKRTLELLVEASDTRYGTSNDKNINSLIFNKKVYEEGPKIVVIGGGSGLNSVLQGLKNYTNNITAIVTVSSYGEEPSDSRKQLELLPLDDIKSSMVALSYNEELMNYLMNYKFKSSKLKNLSFGDIYCLAMKEMCGDLAVAVSQSKNVLNINGEVMPVTLDEIDICAELIDGTVIESRDKIPEVVLNKVSKINRIFINPSNCKPAPGVIEAIQGADAIVIGPGSIYTNVIPNLLVKGVSKAIKESKAIKVYISNIMTELGQTDNYSLSDHVNAILEHSMEGVIDYCIYDTGDIVPEYIKKYNQKGSDLVEQDIQKVKQKGIKLLQRDLACVIDDSIRHNPDAIASSIIELICDELKFKDQHNSSTYLMLDSRLKKIEKELKKNKPRKKKERTEKVGKSKFSAKYNERILSIKNSDEKALKRKEKDMKKSQKEKKQQDDILEKVNKMRNNKK
ncbi:MAG: uridine diphosphate-N-acetylglucosamine-binding protein YvcK [Clostridia bacterium]|nr:uridine diphosphate-N-acetylglucosamine-binding protein YvcK [Clostridia bacterium]